MFVFGFPYIISFNCKPTTAVNLNFHCKLYRECWYIFRTILHWHFCIFDFCEHWFALRRMQQQEAHSKSCSANLPHLSRATIGHFYWPAQGTRPALATGCFACLAHLTLLSLSLPLSYSLTLWPHTALALLLFHFCSLLDRFRGGAPARVPCMHRTGGCTGLPLLYFAWSVVGLSVCQSVCPPVGLCCDRVPSEGCSKIRHELCPKMAFVKRWCTQRTNNEIVVRKINSVAQYSFIRSHKQILSN